MRISLVFFFSIMGCLASGARAQDALAESLFREGKQLFQAERYDEACPKLAESYRVDPRTGTLLANAVCHEAQGKLATAWSEYATVASRARSEGNRAREQQARAKVDALGAQLSGVTLSLAPEAAQIEGLRIALDDTEIGAASLGTRLPLDGGAHVVRIEAPGYRGESIPFDLADSGEQRALVLGAPAPLPTRVPEVVASAPSSAPAAAGPVRAHRALRRTGIAVTSVGAAVLVGAAGLGAHAQRKYEASKAGCNAENTCSPEGKRARDAALAAANATNVMLVAGGVALAGGVVTWLIAARRERRAERATATTLVPAYGARFAGLTMRRTF